MTTLLGPELETVRFFTALGLRFWDAALDVPVRDGLEVVALRRGTADAAVRATRTPSGVYAFVGLPGLRDVEQQSDSIMPASPPASVEFVIAVRDTLGRYLPMTFGVLLPLPTRGLFPDGGVVRLFSAPTRAIPAGMAAVRAELWDTHGETPAAHAVLRVQLGTGYWTGIADEQGRVLIVIPLPTVERLTLGSPPGSGQGAPDDTVWPVAVTARSQVSALSFPLSADSRAAAFAKVPSLRSVLEDQPEVTLFAADDVAAVLSLDADLPFDRPLVLRTQRDVPSEDKGQLWLTPGASPP